jgi:hypothetical protein
LKNGIQVTKKRGNDGNETLLAADLIGIIPLRAESFLFTLPAA